MNLLNKYKNKKILITGNTGFKGSWLTFWLCTLGAKVYGVSNSILTKPSLFNILNLKKKIKYFNFDIKKKKLLETKIKKIKPDFIFHLAAQSLVKKSYLDPYSTFETNTYGTLNLLECIKEIKHLCTIVIITSDKSYRNLELKRGYKENDIIGGFDPYSASKGAAELIINSYIKNFLSKNKNIRIGVARAGNVIGGGDWSADRLIPDCVKSWADKKEVIIRNPNSTRPWQHVFEVIAGYLLFGIKINLNKKINGEVFNFGPNTKKNYKVIELIKELKKNWKNISWRIEKKKKRQVFYESTLLKLNSKKANKILGWKCILSFSETSKLVSDWYKCFYKNRENIKLKSYSDIKFFEKLMFERL
jgi:CDP-glucose 4,6-dehydratase